MAAGDNVGINPGTQANVAADAVTRPGDAGVSFAQFMKVLDGTDASVVAWVIEANGAARVTDSGITTSGDTKQLLIDPLNNADGGAGVGAYTGVGVMANRKTLLVFNDSDVRLRYAFATPKTAVNRGVIPSGQSMRFSGTLPVFLWAETGGAGGSKSAIVTEVA
jgi:hypothetical protein